MQANVRRGLLLLAVLTAGLATDGQAQQILYGHLENIDPNAVDARVVRNGGGHDVTVADGRFTLRPIPGKWCLVARKVGYKPYVGQFEAPVGDNMFLEVILQRR